MAILLVDSLNIFIRNYVVNPSMTVNGEQCGGIVGFLNSLKSVCYKIKPNKIYFIWESGGSYRRRSIYSDYKKGRKPFKPNRYYDDIPDSHNNKIWQVASLTNLLKFLPIYNIYVSDCEGDDVISYLCKRKFINEKKIIFSSDKDYYQLLDNNTIIYTPGRKIFLNKKSIEDSYDLPVENFCIAKAICGDPGDNLNGVKGVGFKTVAKRLPILQEQNIMLSDVLDYCKNKSKDSKLKIYKNIALSEDLIRRNWKLMYLDGSFLTHKQLCKIDYVIEETKLFRDKLGMIRKFIELGIQDYNVDSLFHSILGVNSGNNT